MEIELIGFICTIISVLLGIIGIIISIIIYLFRGNNKDKIIKRKGNDKSSSIIQADNISQNIYFNDNTYKKEYDNSNTKINKVSKDNDQNLKNTKKVKREVIHKDNIIVPHKSYMQINHYLFEDNILKGNIKSADKYKLNVYILDGNNFEKFSNNKNFKSIKKYKDIYECEIYYQALYEELIYIVFDATYKQKSRLLNVYLEIISKN
ncbi:MAG: hypothetical protein QCI00_01715 [Candidatus Thermoplasmatota archaeon]|nr:hypothetical protein [Candidatus Thermoplasmatota archaeon]